MNMEEMIDEYFRPGRLPHIWCPGCGNGIVTGCIVKAVALLLRMKYLPRWKKHSNNKSTT